MFNLIKLYKCILQIITQSKFFQTFFCFNVDKHWLMKSCGIRLIGNSKLPISVNVSANGCLSLC